MKGTEEEVQMIQQLVLPSGGQLVTTQLIPAGARVTVVISGVVGIWAGWAHGIDAAYVYDAPPGSIYYPVITPIHRLGILTANGHFDPAPAGYNQAHQYTWETVGTGQGIWFQFQDQPYDDNTGSFGITVIW
jgi:hypothetical protein